MAWGDKGKDWVGKRMTLYNDPTVKWAGVEVGGIRISHLSDLGSPEKSFQLTVTRGKKRPHTVKQLDSTPYPPANFEANFPKWKEAIASGAATPQNILARVTAKGALTDDQKKSILAIQVPDEPAASPGAESDANTESGGTDAPFAPSDADLEQGGLFDSSPTAEDA